MKKKLFSLILMANLLASLTACVAPHQHLKRHTTPGHALQKPNGCIMETGQCKPAAT